MSGPACQTGTTRLGLPACCLVVSVCAAPALALDGPFIRRNLTPFGVAVLPGDVLAFELAHEWNGYHAGIYVASLRSRTIARLCDGRNPVVVYPHAVAE